MSETPTTTPRYRPVPFGVTRVSVREGAPGTRYLQAELPLGAYARRLSDFLVHWAEAEPERSFMARREQLGDGRTGDWLRISYAQALDGARRIGQALLDRKLSAERPVVILSENTLEHALMSLGCIYAGVPYCPVSPAYATISQDYDKLKHVLSTLTPGLVFAADGARYGRAISATVGSDVE
ncbi:MAG: feruloyl-CoA synthase, partial [Hyphomicrobiaceae bacterium]